MYLARKLLIGDTIFMSPTGDESAILLGHPGRSSHLRGKGSTFVSQLCLRP